MVNAIKCDKCGCFNTDGYQVHIYKLDEDYQLNDFGKDKDLCVNCFRELGLNNVFNR